MQTPPRHPVLDFSRVEPQR